VKHRAVAGLSPETPVKFRTERLDGENTPVSIRTVAACAATERASDVHRHRRRRLRCMPSFFCFPVTMARRSRTTISPV
jgi:hypothetical protein